MVDCQHLKLMHLLVKFEKMYTLFFLLELYVTITFVHSVCWMTSNINIVILLIALPAKLLFNHVMPEKLLTVY